MVFHNFNSSLFYLELKILILKSYIFDFLIGSESDVNIF